jgi:hypothetical protein
MQGDSTIFIGNTSSKFIYRYMKACLKKDDKKLSIFEHGLDDYNKGEIHRIC